MLSDWSEGNLSIDFRWTEPQQAARRMSLTGVSSDFPRRPFCFSPPLKWKWRIERTSLDLDRRVNSELEL